MRNRKSIRLKDYDYSQAGAYFVTICVKNGECVLGEVSDGKVKLNEMGSVLENTWYELLRHYPSITLDEFVVMPNHFHGIIMLDVGAQFIAPFCVMGVINHAPTLGKIIRHFKAKSSYLIHKTNQDFFWQRNYFEHVIRNENDLSKIREYIQNNPLKWELDPENPYVENRMIAQQ